MSLENTYESYLKFILEGDKKNSRRVIEEAIKSGVPAIDIYYHVFYPTMVKTGELWQKNKISVAREHMITATTQNIIASLYPLIFKDLAEQENSRGKILIACPGEELHELGIRMLADIWELEGWDVTYLGSNIPARFITDSLIEENHDILALSNSISFNLKYSKETIEKAKAAGYRGFTVVGGRVFNVDPTLKDYVGADYHGSDFYQAVQILEEIEQNKTDH